MNFKQQLERGTDKDRVAFDVRMSGLLLDAASGADKEGAAVLAAAYTPGVMPYSGDSELIGNYANTLVNTSFWGGEYIHQGSRRTRPIV